MGSDANTTDGKRITRRAFLRAGMFGAPLLGAAAGFSLWPEWLRVRQIALRPDPVCRLVHFTDTHHKGDRAWLSRVVDAVNALDADFVCFTGDIIEEAAYLDEALDILTRVNRPLYGVPGNHDYWSGADFSVIAEAFGSTGGAWLTDRAVTAPGGVRLLGSTGKGVPEDGVVEAARRVLLVHYPAFALDAPFGPYDFVLAGHSHGGQVRVPFFGAPVVPGRTRPYDLGLFDTPSGPLYVNPGIGTWYLDVRVFCRPEVTLVQV